MTVAQLIEKLQAMPQDAEVWSIYDGFCSVDPDHVWVARGGHVVMVSEDSPVYHDDDRPEWAPREKTIRTWLAPKAK